MARRRTQIESFGMVVFASEWPQNPELHPARTHTFAAFIHEKPDGQMDQYIISWLPKCGIIDGFLQVGANYCLQRTLEWSFNGGMSVYAWHAYEIKEALFESAVRRASALASGSYWYYFFGTGPRNLNCAHALSGLDVIPPPDVELAIYGVNASRACLDRMRRWSWQSADPGKYEAVLHLPPQEILWLRDDQPVSSVGIVDAKQYFTNFARDLPSRVQVDEGKVTHLLRRPQPEAEPTPESGGSESQKPDAVADGHTADSPEVDAGRNGE